MSPSRRKQAPRRIALFNKADWSSFRKFVSNLGEEITRAASRSANSETLWQMFKDKIDKGVQLFIPFKTTKPRDSQPWIDRKLKRKIRLRDRAFKKCKKRGSEDDEKKFQQLKREVQREQRKAYWQYVEDLFTPLDDHSQFGGKKKFYKFIKHKKSDYNGVAR